MKRNLMIILSLVLVVLMVSCVNKKTYTVVFNSNGGTEISSVSVVEGSKVTRPTDPTKSGYAFSGWYKEETLVNAWRFSSDTVESDITLYAKYVENEEEIEEEETFDLGGINFVIMVDNANRADPRSKEYERLFQAEKIAKIQATEAKYNINIVYQTYPSNASWGGARERWIIEQTKNANPAQILEITTNSIPNLAEQKVISPLDEYISKYGSKAYWPEKARFSTVKGVNYAYDDNYTYADTGIYYNSTLLAQILGESRKNEPTEKWMNGTWTWEAFEELCNEINPSLDETRAQEAGGPQYVIGGRTYNWAYPLIGTNGAVLIDGDYKTHFTSDPVIETLDYLNGLYQHPGMWIDDAPLDNTAQPQFLQGNVVFHNGESWYLTVSNKWLNKTFDVDFVPFPVGPRAQADMSLYHTNINTVSSYVISSAYKKENIPSGYENLMMHDETIFKIWRDIQYFPSIDKETGYGSLQPIQDNFFDVRLLPNYASELSRQAHLSIFNKTYPEFFYILIESQAQDETSFMIKIQATVRTGDSRNVMLAVKNGINALLIERFNLPEDYFDDEED